MLNSRVITSLLLAPFVFITVLALPTNYFSLVMVAIILLAAMELARLGGLQNTVAIAGYLLLQGLALALVYQLLDSQYLVWMAYALAAWWVLVLLVLLSGRWVIRENKGIKPLVLAGGMLLLSGCWAALVGIHGMQPHGPKLVMFLFMLVWVADIGAYFSGRQWGSHKLAPAVSPGKTIEGVYGALAGAALCALALFYFDWLPGISLLQLLTLCMACILISVAGDLWESVLKRQQGVKDSGTLLPGHGGILDRIDSQIAAVPFFLAGLLFLGQTL